MGVYIKGMEMPKSCDECRFMVFEDTNCEVELYCGCPIVFKAHPQGVDHRPDYCPLVSVPPHGRLIEKATLLDKCYQHYEDYMLGKTDGKAALLNIEKEIKAAPTIIPQKEE